MTELLHLADRLSDNRLWTPQQMLADVLREIEAGTITPNRALLLLVRDEPAEPPGESYYGISYRLANMSATQGLAAVAIGQKWILDKVRIL